MNAAELSTLRIRDLDGARLQSMRPTGAFDFADDSVVKVGDTEALKRYVNSTQFLSACDLCNGRSFSAKEIEPAIQTRTPLKMEL